MKRDKKDKKKEKHPGCHASCCIPTPSVKLCADGTPASMWDRQGATYARESQT